MSADDAVLAAAVARGDHSAFEELHRRYQDRVSRIVSAILRGACANPQDYVEDVKQDVWLRIWQRAGQYRSHDGSFIGWLIGITKNASIDYIKKIRGQRVTPFEDLEAKGLLRDGPAEDTETRVGNWIILQSIWEKLSPEERTLAILISKGHKNKEIAQALEVSEGAVKLRKYRLVRKLQKLAGLT